jgi:hypothetical protein
LIASAASIPSSRFCVSGLGAPSSRRSSKSLFLVVPRGRPIPVRKFSANPAPATNKSPQAHAWRAFCLSEAGGYLDTPRRERHAVVCDVDVASRRGAITPPFGLALRRLASNCATLHTIMRQQAPLSTLEPGYSTAPKQKYGGPHHRRHRDQKRGDSRHLGQHVAWLRGAPYRCRLQCKFGQKTTIASSARSTSTPLDHPCSFIWDEGCRLPTLFEKRRQ